MQSILENLLKALNTRHSYKVCVAAKIGYSKQYTYDSHGRNQAQLTEPGLRYRVSGIGC